MAETSKPPSKRRLRRARQHGIAAASSELTSAGGLAAAILVLVALASQLFPPLVTTIQNGLHRAATARITHDPGQLLAIAAEFPPSLLSWLHVSIWVFAAGAGISIVVGLIQTRAMIAPARCLPAWQRLKPGNALVRLWSVETILALAAVAAKGVVIAVLVGELLMRHAGDLANLAGLPVARAGRVTGVVAALLVMRIGLALFAFGLIDWVLQRRQHRRALMMSRQEARREERESGRDPVRRSHRRQVHAEIVAAGHSVPRSRQAVRGGAVTEQSGRSAGYSIDPAAVAAAVQRSCLVITGDQTPVALARDPRSMTAPRVAAHGAHLVGRHIADLARRTGIPVVHDRLVADAVNALPIGAAIPDHLHLAVARIMAAWQ
ncbi:MAG: EscU/YscU/HrcU family type III secretion system export apparatus switch protein [Proteobacteria bacterium]|nr:EscU/YscU/HrcU family type III secretion system export apparatus switch protein [Pseudomonadota bacterium]